MSDKPIIIDSVDVSKCPAMDTYNIFGIEDKPCCYKFHEYCSAIPNCYFKQLKQTEQKLENIKEICNMYQMEYIVNNGVKLLTNKILQIIGDE